MEEKEKPESPSSPPGEAQQEAGAPAQAPAEPPAASEPQLPVPSAQPAPTDLTPVPDFDPVPVRARHDGWSPERQRAFVEHLAETLSAAAAAARVGMSEQSAYALRRRSGSGAFAAAWDAALRRGIRDKVGAIALDRAVNGTIVRRYYHGELVAEERVHSDRLLLALLTKADKLFPPTPESDAVIADWDGAMERLESGDAGNFRVWQDERGVWLTSFPPPPDFAGYHEGQPGDEGFCRTLSKEEAEAVAADRSAMVEEGEEARNRFFGFKPSRRGASPRRRGAADRKNRSKRRRS